MKSEARAVLDLVGALTGTGPSSLASVFYGLLDSQAKLLAVQTNALAIQNGPPSASFSGKDIEVEANSFTHWLGKFEERANLLSWTEEQKCFHKQLLVKTACQVFEILPPETCSNYGALVTALKDRFKPVDIAELRGLEFQQLTQKEQFIEQLGLQLMQLAKKGFPTLGTTELDRMLKGRFFQALLPKWQGSKLWAPKLDESFNALYDRARVCEQHDQQYKQHWGSSFQPKASGAQKHL